MGRRGTPGCSITKCEMRSRRGDARAASVRSAFWRAAWMRPKGSRMLGLRRGVEWEEDAMLLLMLFCSYGRGDGDGAGGWDGIPFAGAWLAFQNPGTGPVSGPNPTSPSAGPTAKRPASSCVLKADNGTPPFSSVTRLIKAHSPSGTTSRYILREDPRNGCSLQAAAYILVQ